MDSFLTSLFQFLFKYQPVVFDRGELVFSAPWPFLVVAVGGLVLATPPLLTYSLVRGKLSTFDRVALAIIRVSALGLIVFCLLRPVLVIASVVPQQNYLGILLDDSRSMQIADRDQTSRSDFIVDEFAMEDSDLLTRLGERFKLRFFRFAESTDRIETAADLTFNGTQTKLGPALDRVRRELSAVPLAGVIVVSDGADNATEPLTESILQLRARGVPVHTVGLGLERFAKDIEVSRVEAPRTVLEGSSVAVDVMLTQSGYEGQEVQVNVEDAGRIVTTQVVRLPSAGEIATVRVLFTAEESGARLFRFRVLEQDGEQVLRNNVREALIVVEEKRQKILYFEGEPRFEVKFVRRAVAEDENLQVVTLQQTAENKFYRLDVDDEDELASGFPKTREELFAYRGLILGSVRASHFTHDQLQMITEFVAQRGGGLLTLGGRYAFGEGGYAGTSVADVLPVVIEAPQRRDSSFFFTEVRVELTPFGRAHPIAQIAESPETSGERWAELPAVSMLNPIRETKPGASTLLTGSGDGGDDFIVLATQRYGRGRSVAFPVQDSWMWQMHADIPLDDMTHENFWRQLLRWLVSGVPEHVTPTVPKDRVGLQESVTITAEIVDSAYLHVNDAEVVVEVTPPTSQVTTLPMTWTVERDGEYQASFVPAEPGLYEMRVEARRDGQLIGEATAYVQAAEPVDEYFDAEMRSALLRRVSDETGGHFYTPETVSALPEDVQFTESGATVYEEKDLWDMPIILLLLIGLIGSEWAFRRKRGLT